MLQYSLVFVVTLITDGLWAYYIAHTAAKNAWRATFSSGAIVLSGAFVILTYIDDHLALIPALIGGMIGTYITVRYSK